MSGTSLDGIDAVLVDLSESSPQQLAKHFLPYDEALKDTLLELHRPKQNELHQANITSNQLAKLYALAVTQMLSQANISCQDVLAIGNHGQTIRHCPDQGYSLQIGNAALLAELTGITVISDFRSRDVAAGGQGAPLVPAFHDKIFRHPDIHRVIVNIGGISNLTNLPPHLPASGHDCGPGNLLLDVWCLQHQAAPYDNNGTWASSGVIIHSLLEQMRNEAYFALPPPKSCGRELFNMGWLQEKLNGKEKPEDVQATLLELTCQSITQAVRQYSADVEEVYLCGGGANNQALETRLKVLLDDCSVQKTDVLGVNANHVEAFAFAWMAQQTLHAKPANLPQVTGAMHPCILGAIYQA